MKNKKSSYVIHHRLGVGTSTKLPGDGNSTKQQQNLLIIIQLSVTHCCTVTNTVIHTGQRSECLEWDQTHFMWQIQTSVCKSIAHFRHVWCSSSPGSQFFDTFDFWSKIIREPLDLFPLIAPFSVMPQGIHLNNHKCTTLASYYKLHTAEMEGLFPPCVSALDERVYMRYSPQW